MWVGLTGIKLFVLNKLKEKLHARLTDSILQARVRKHECV